MSLFYPNNFPKQLESALLEFLLFLQKEKSELNELIVRKKMYSFFSRKNNAKILNGKTPPFWWLQFILIRYKKQFTSDFLHNLKHILTKTKIRSLSGIVPLTVFTKGTACPFNCIYCPNEPGVPKSYLSDEPAIMRAIRNIYDPFKQVQSRLLMFLLSGHPIDKIELIIKGGTFSFLPRNYRTRFVKRLFDGANTQTSRLLEKGSIKQKHSNNIATSQKQNEKESTRIIGITIETRPDFITSTELRYLRKLGVTHVEIGVQHPDNDIYSQLKRGHTVEDVKKATQQLRDAGFKIGYHIMPNLPGSSPVRDKKMLDAIFTNPFFKPDHLKLYPTTITKHTQLFTWYSNKQYQPYPTHKLIEILAKWKAHTVPPWVRIGRLTRDITTNMMNVNLFPPNLGEILHAKMRSLHYKCNCIRCREIHNMTPIGPVTFRSISYDAADGVEYFIEAVDAKLHCLGFIRARLPSYLFSIKNKPLFASIANCILIRELHVYGKALTIGANSQKDTQHKGIGDSLLKQVESIALQKKLNCAIISGIGVREYYKKHGYTLNDTYMIKHLQHINIVRSRFNK